MRRLLLLPLLIVTGCRTLAMVEDHLPRPVVVESSSSSSSTPSASRSSGDVHWLAADEYFVSETAPSGAWIYVHRARMSRAASGNGDAGFTRVNDASELTTRYYWRARPAHASELAVGRKVVVFDTNRDSDGTYAAPTSKDDSMNGAWFLATIADLSDLDGNIVRVSGGYKVRVEALRLVEGDTAPVVTASVGSEDQHWFASDDFFISDSDLSGTFNYVKLAKQVEAPSAATKNLGKYFIPLEGETKFTKYAWRTRLASKGDLKLGTTVICYENNQDSEGVYSAPTSKDDSRGGAWFMAKVADTSDLFRDFVTTSGGYKCRLNALRVTVK